MSVREGYGRWAASYDSDRNLTRDLDQVVTRTVLGQERVGTLLELGCGTGKNTRLYAQIAGSVRALDFSEEMLSQARAKGLPGHVSFTVADLTRPWPCDEASADLIACNLVLEHIADLSFVFNEAARCLKADGRFFVSELHPFRQYSGARARQQNSQEADEIPAFIHPISEFLEAAADAGLHLLHLKEWWHEDERNTPPRLISFLWKR